MQVSLTNPAFQQTTLEIILASSRFAQDCVEETLKTGTFNPKDLGQQQYHTSVCQNTQELLHRIRHQSVDLLVLDILFLQHQTQRFCWRLQDLYPELKIIVLGKTPAELSSCNWVYEYPNVSTACLANRHSVPGSSTSTSPKVHQSPMTSDSQPTISESLQNTYLKSVVGAAVFDLSGLPREYLVTDEVDNVGWVQTIFQALGLRSLLMSSLQLEGFHYASTCGQGYRAIVVKQKDQYIALLLKPEYVDSIAQELIQWAKGFDPNELKLYPQFRVA